MILLFKDQSKSFQICCQILSSYIPTRSAFWRHWPGDSRWRSSVHRRRQAPGEGPVYNRLLLTGSHTAAGRPPPGSRTAESKNSRKDKHWRTETECSQVKSSQGIWTSQQTLCPNKSPKKGFLSVTFLSVKHLYEFGTCSGCRLMALEKQITALSYWDFAIASCPFLKLQGEKSVELFSPNKLGSCHNFVYVWSPSIF